MQEVKNMDVLSVTRDCELRKFIEKECGLRFERGRAYYQFVREAEDIFYDTDIVVMNKVIDHCNDKYLNVNHNVHVIITVI